MGGRRWRGWVLAIGNDWFGIGGGAWYWEEGGCGGGDGAWGLVGGGREKEKIIANHIYLVALIHPHI